MVYRPTARVLTVLELLQAHGRMTGAELARRLEVNIRTVRDYIETLSDLGIPVEAERGRYGAYKLRPGYKLPPLIFTEDEAQALTLSLLMARENGLAQTSSAFEGALVKIERVLPAPTRERIRAVEETVIFENSSAHVAPAIAAVTMLSLAVKGELSVHLRYRTSPLEVTERLFDPYGVVAHEGFWYTIGYCHLRQTQRLFRLDRIDKIAITNETFTRPPTFEALSAVQRALASVPRVWQVEVWLEATLEEAQRKSQLSKGHFTEESQGVLVRSEVADLPWMARLLVGMGLPFIIHQPPELREVVREYALTMIGYAERSKQGQAEV
ncbi:helix-turn-helix transcriptional regulator [Tengunoibacter tsumagoiensis]|uniref:Transcriptional regulator n=1 Tax=Tengunoibacter tsumagoiensis TaxID=2014871 RepID=A0A402A562_9CHLR|nr:YafY family protein [Tengunoibacter tsumagoiensis]GCE14145.1 transcriptional regulator [Tengunoibacter tsumagoiensis]